MRFAAMLLFLALPGLNFSADSSAVFEKRLHMRVYKIETLASVVNRVEVQLGLRLVYAPKLLAGKLAKSKTYDLTTGADILKDQLSVYKLELVRHSRGLMIAPAKTSSQKL